VVLAVLVLAQPLQAQEFSTLVAAVVVVVMVQRVFVDWVILEAVTVAALHQHQKQHLQHQTQEAAVAVQDGLMKVLAAMAALAL
jgi:hypothetical protein